MPSHGIMTVPL